MLQLSDIATINMGQSPSSNTYNTNELGLPFFQGNADFGEMSPITRIFCSSPTKTAIENDILFSVRAPIGAINVSNCKCCIGRGLAAISAKKGVALSKYLYYLLRAKKPYIEQQGTGSTFKAINKKVLQELPIQNICLTEQRKVIDILDTISNAICMRKEQMIELDNLVKSQFIDMFGDPVENEKRWSQHLLGSVTTKIGSGSTPNGGKSSYPSKGISFIRSMNVYDGVFIYDDLAFLTDEQAEKLKSVTIRLNDILFNITGASIARSCIVPNDVLPARVNQHVAIIRLNDKLSPIFMNYQLTSLPMKWKLLGIGESSGATRQAITKADLEKLEVIIPPLEVQKQFASFVEQIDKSKFAIQQSLNELENCYNALMQQYFG